MKSIYENSMANIMLNGNILYMSLKSATGLIRKPIITVCIQYYKCSLNWLIGKRKIEGLKIYIFFVTEGRIFYTGNVRGHVDRPTEVIQSLVSFLGVGTIYNNH